MKLKAAGVVVVLMWMWVAPTVSFTAPLLNAGRWEMIANRFSVSLNITSVDAQGILTGTIVEGTRTDQVKGFWDEQAKRIVFVRTINNPSTIQVFTGYLFDPGATFCQGGETQRMMAGAF